MPTANERVENKGLDGQELLTCILNDVRTMLERDAMFSKRLSYDRAAYRFKIQLFMQNPTYPEHVNQGSSAPPAKGGDKSGGRGALDTPDKIAGGKNVVKEGKQRDRVIDSPNLARIDNKLPLSVQMRDPESGRIVERQQQFDGEGGGADYPDLNKSSDKDITNEEWK